MIGVCGYINPKNQCLLFNFHQPYHLRFQPFYIHFTQTKNPLIKNPNTTKKSTTINFTLSIALPLYSIWYCSSNVSYLSCKTFFSAFASLRKTTNLLEWSLRLECSFCRCSWEVERVLKSFWSDSKLGFNVQTGVDTFWLALDSIGVLSNFERLWRLWFKIASKSFKCTNVFQNSFLLRIFEGYFER